MSISRASGSILIILTLSFTSLLGQGYSIDLELKGLSRDTVVLGEYFNTRMVPKDTIVLDHKGRGTFSGETAFKGGMYLVYFKPGRYFDFLLGDNQQFKISADTSRLNESLSFEGDVNNEVFSTYKYYLAGKREELAEAARDSATMKEVRKELNSEMEAYIDRLQEEQGDLFVATFVNTTREPAVPEKLLNGEKRHDDSLRYFYYREHYLDHFNPHDVRLLHTPLYENKLKTYITRVVPQHPDSLIVATDFLLTGARGDEELYRYLLITLFNHFAESKYIGMDAVYFHIAEHYYIPDAHWSNEEFKQKLQENLALNKPTLIGQPAPNVKLRMVPANHFGLAAQDTAIKSDPYIGYDFMLYDIPARYTILYFWEADCGHCKKSTPALYQVYERMKDKGVQVVSVHVINSIEGKEKWVDFINDYHLLDWVNCWSPFDNEFRKQYNLQSFPQMFIFDENKKIVAKKVSPEQAEQIINNLIAAEAK